MNCDEKMIIYRTSPYGRLWTGLNQYFKTRHYKRVSIGTIPNGIVHCCTGHGLIQERNINTEIVEFEVSGDKIEAVHMIPGWTHNIINLSETENLVTVMTCNEVFNPAHPDTFLIQ